MGALADILERCVERADRIAVIDHDRSLSYGELADRSLGLASLLQSRGVGPGDRVAFLGPTSYSWHEFVLATAWIGAVPVTLNWRLTPRELSPIIEHARPVVLLGRSAMVAHLATSNAVWPHVMVIEETDDLLATSPRAGAAATTSSTATALQIYTSGTTGRPKGVELSDIGLATFIAGAVGSFDLDEQSRGLCTLPLFHVAGSIFALLNLAAGSTSVIPESSSAEQIVSSISSYGITHLPMVPTMMLTLVDYAEVHDHDLSSVRRVIYGGASITPTLLRRTISTIGPVFLHTYGLTEATGFVTVLEPNEHDPDSPDRLKSCGRVVPWAELRIADVNTGRELSSDEVGEVQVRSVAVMSGYFEDPDLTSLAMTTDGFLRTGDLGRMDGEGFLTIVDRVKELIITGGENVSPSEVEDALTTHPAVSQAVALGVPDERWGELVTAVLVLRSGHDKIPEDLTDHLAARLASYKRPKRIEVTNELPLNATGKVDRNELRKRLTAPPGPRRPLA